MFNPAGMISLKTKQNAPSLNFRFLALALATSLRKTTTTKQPSNEMRELRLCCQTASAKVSVLFQLAVITDVITALLHQFTDAPTRHHGEKGWLLNGMRCALDDGIARENVT